MGLSGDKPTAKRIIDFQSKFWVCAGSLSWGSTYLCGDLFECVPAGLYKGPAYEKDKPEYQGLRFTCSHFMTLRWSEPQEFVFTDLQVVVRIVNPFEKNLYRAMR